jgi:uncharacterized protein (DUF305 family)
MMVPHHRGAVDMALPESRYRMNEQLRRIAQEIMVNLTQEISAMKLAIGDRPKIPHQRRRSVAGSGHAD